MYNRAICLLLGLLFSTFLIAKGMRSDTVYSKYESGEYSSFAQIRTSADIATAEKVADALVHDFQTNPHRLFDWALKGLGTQEDEKDKRNDVILEWKETKFDKMTGVSTFIVDIIVLNKKVYKDVEVRSKAFKTKRLDGSIEVSLDILYSNALLKKAYGTFFVIPDNDKVLLKMELHVRFGWFFNIFVTQNRYRSLIEWRLDGFCDNMRIECEQLMNFRK